MGVGVPRRARSQREGHSLRAVSASLRVSTSLAHRTVRAALTRTAFARCVVQRCWTHHPIRCLASSQPHLTTGSPSGGTRGKRPDDEWMRARRGKRVATRVGQEASEEREHRYDDEGCGAQPLRGGQRPCGRAWRRGGRWGGCPGELADRGAGSGGGEFAEGEVGEGDEEAERKGEGMAQPTRTKACRRRC